MNRCVPVSVEKLQELTDYTATIVNKHDELVLKSGDTCWAAFKARCEPHLIESSSVAQAPQYAPNYIVCLPFDCQSTPPSTAYDAALVP
eukprot:1192946-Prorocentrum_minimum.AAC.11